MSTQELPPPSPLQAAFLSLIKAEYLTWYLAQLPSGKWQVIWYANAHDARYMESMVAEDAQDDHELRVGRRATALRIIIRSLDDEISQGGGDSFVEARDRAMASLIDISLRKPGAIHMDEFSGTGYELELREAWYAQEVERAASDRAAAARRDERRKQRAEQARRELAFRRVHAAFGLAVIEAINDVIWDVWQREKPTFPFGAKGGARSGDPRPMPRLTIMNGKVAISSPGRLAAFYIRSPVSKWMDDRGITPHWMYETWALHAAPAIGELIDRLDLKVQREMLHRAGAVETTPRDEVIITT